MKLKPQNEYELKTDPELLFDYYKYEKLGDPNSPIPEDVYDAQDKDFVAGSGGIRKAGLEVPYSMEQAREIQICRKDPIYFIEKYIKIVHPDEGLINFKLRDYQKKIVINTVENRFNIYKIPRQAGKTTTTAAIYAWLITMYSYEMCGIVANKEELAYEIMQKIQLMLSSLPFWLQQGVTKYSGGYVKLENGSYVKISATSRNAFRGFTIKRLFWDECCGFDEKITIRNKKTGKIEHISIGEFTNRLKEDENNRK